MSHSAANMYQTTSYVEDYLDCIESLPNDLQRSVSQIREIDNTYQSVLREIKQLYETLVTKDLDNHNKRRTLIHLHRCLIQSQELGDEKLQFASQISEIVENRLRQMNMNRTHLEIMEKPEHPPDPPPKTKKAAPAVIEQEAPAEKASKRLRRGRNSDVKEKDNHRMPQQNDNNPKAKKKKRNKAKERDILPIDPPIDPNEPTYCLCQQVSYGDMVGCDNKDCPYEWFHFGCVGLSSKPKGKWYCPKCLPEVKKK
ncbi:inhibitor of growth protein 1-like [Lytechinus variegatus]|uniref:inhibitor of growth protein 1-like n=1 Tax=Lytechinus variegatus TaxID=7654 RepID=UPI001BB1B5D9|nr:inhibitor of growth protein 1-like [Lytechinus variegatus]